MKKIGMPYSVSRSLHFYRDFKIDASILLYIQMEECMANPHNE